MVTITITTLKNVGQGETKLRRYGRSHFTQNTYHDIESQIYKVKDK